MSARIIAALGHEPVCAGTVAGAHEALREGTSVRSAGVLLLPKPFGSAELARIIQEVVARLGGA